MFRKTMVRGLMAVALVAALLGGRRRLMSFFPQGWHRDRNMNWLCHKRLSSGRFRCWPAQGTTTKTLAAHQLQVLLAAGDPEATQAAPAWRPVCAGSGCRSSRRGSSSSLRARKLVELIFLLRRSFTRARAILCIEAGMWSPPFWNRIPRRATPISPGFRHFDFRNGNIEVATCQNCRSAVGESACSQNNESIRFRCVPRCGRRRVWA